MYKRRKQINKDLNKRWRQEDMVKLIFKKERESVSMYLTHFQAAQPKLEANIIFNTDS